MDAAATPWNRFGSKALSDKPSGQLQETAAKFSLSFFWLTSFYFVYCARPGDTVPGFGEIHPAKITGGLAALSLLFSLRTSGRQLKDIPKEGFYLLLLILLLLVSAVLSPVWRGGALDTALDFSKVFLAWVATFMLVTTLRALRRIVFIQSASVALVSLAAIVKGHSVPRLEGVIGGLYSNSNDLALAIALCMPFCLAFLLTAKSVLRKASWLCAIVVMTAALMLTASRGGFIDLGVAGIVLLWHFGIKGKRTYLIIGALALILGAFGVEGKQLAVRWNGFFGRGASEQQDTAHDSYVQRKTLVTKAIQTIAEYPILGVGAGNFVVHSRMWRDVHVVYLQIAVDGGIFALILYLMFFARGFTNLRLLFKSENLDTETVLFAGAVKSSLVGFVVGACFAPVAYQFFPYFFVCYSSVLLAIVNDRAESQNKGGAAVASPVVRGRRTGSGGRFNGLMHTC